MKKTWSQKSRGTIYVTMIYMATCVMLLMRPACKLLGLAGGGLGLGNWEFFEPCEMASGRQACAIWGPKNSRFKKIWGSPSVIPVRKCQPVVGKMTTLTFELYPWGEGHGVQGQICDILRPQLAIAIASCPSGHTDSYTLDTYIRGEGAMGGLW